MVAKTVVGDDVAAADVVVANVAFRDISGGDEFGTCLMLFGERFGDFNEAFFEFNASGFES